MKKGLILAFACMMQMAMADYLVPFASDLWIFPVKINKTLLSGYCESYAEKYLGDASVNFTCEVDSNIIRFQSQIDSSVGLKIENCWYDSAFCIDMERLNQWCSETYPNDSTYGTPATYPFSQVLAAELMRLQELGIVENERDSFEVFLDTTIESMKTSKRCPDIEYSGLGPGCCSLVESSESLPRISQVSPGVRATKVSPGKFRLSGVPLGTELSVFNLKGQMLLRKSFDGGLLEIPNVPAVARVGGNWVKLE